MAKINQRGFSQIELMITLVIVSVAFIAAVSAFRGVAKGILVSKTKSLATNLAQEDVELMKDKSYYRLRVSDVGSLTAVTGPTPAVYEDTANYPVENLIVGGIAFQRYIRVDKVRIQAGTDNLELALWDDPDTGLKKVTVTTVWKEGNTWKQLFLINLRENPDRAAADVAFSGTVTDQGTSAPIQNVVVAVVENPGWQALTDSGGNYSFNLAPGSYTLRASIEGYFLIL